MRYKQLQAEIKKYDTNNKKNYKIIQIIPIKVKVMIFKKLLIHIVIKVYLAIRLQTLIPNLKKDRENSKQC